MEIIETLMSQTPTLLLQVIYVLGVYVLIQMMYNLGSIIYNIIHAFISAASLTYCAITSAKQKAVVNKTKYAATAQSVALFLWRNFILHASADGAVVYDSPDFKWVSIFEFETYNTFTKNQ